ncbi:MAG: hypothetical protein NXI32_04425 [bacterium]|nr:hypothetical protein [bacterium]
MSGSKRKRESLAPSLFPFLAVLLCTMGALVLILMLVVSAAQADAEQIAQQIQERKEELVSLADHAVDSYRKKLEDSQLELEKKRLQLQHYEEHILELAKELKELEAQHEQAQSEEATAADLDRHKAKISELERQLAEAEEELKELEKKPQGDKPIFAVIPYRGPNGTHRRPIYLECTSQGIVLQPEGNLISLQDLQPPHGPGNPLDAALRAVRTEYKPANGAITRTAYPLLLVRPSGIRAYALARSAMSGWDDQFGYELIEEEMDLAYPEGKPGLHAKVEDALALARERQAALVMAMPGRYQMELDDLSPLTGSQGGGRGSPATARGTGGSAAGVNATGGYGGLPGSANVADSQNPGSRSASGPSGMETLTTSNAAPGDRLLAGGSGQPAGQAFADGTGTFVEGSSPMSFEGQSQTGSDSNFGSAGSASPSGTLGAHNQNGGGQSGGSQPLAAGSLASSPTSAVANGAATDQSGQANQGQFAASSSNGSAEGSGSSAAASGQPGQSSGDSTTSAGAQSGQSYPGMSSSMAMQSSSGSSTPSPTDSEMAEQQAAPQFSMNVDLSDREQNTRPVAAGRGRDWAWSDGPRTQNPIVRSLYLHCYDDRWILLPENGKPDQGFLIPFDGTPEERAELLAKAVQRRVEEWGFALSGGYWKPELVVDVAPGAEWRYRQLVRLFEGSGLDIRQRTNTASRREAR